MGFPKCSLVASTYNWPKALELLLTSALHQTYLPDEVIIADDGSTKETKFLIEKFQKNFPVPLVHIWHEDDGNRKSVIMNKAIAKAKYEYVIEIDGDIILHKNFIEDHLQFAEKQQYLYGSRVTIKSSFLPELWQKKQTVFHFFSSGISKRGRTLHFPFLTKFIKPIVYRSSKFRGCNVSFWREDFIKINGYNEAFKGWGMEDSEMIQRLHNIGIVAKRLKFAGIAFHIYHKEQSKDRVSFNAGIEKETTEKKITFTEKGIAQYL